MANTNNPHFLILAGDGINCERETSFALQNANAKTSIIHVNDLMENPTRLNDFDGMALPGGFSFGDEIASGQVLALKIKHGLDQEFARFVDDKKPIIGICNGFQVLLKLGLLPWPETDRTMALTHNESGTFIDCWSTLKVDQKSVCKWTQFLETDNIELPIRHGEGRIVLKKGQEEEIFNKLKSKGQLPLYYKENINGSFKNIAGVCDPSGMILGMMPHPEAFVFQATYRLQAEDNFAKGQGQLIFDSMIQYLNQ